MSSDKRGTFKRLVVCTDGTWNDVTKGHATNVVKLARAVRRFDADGVPQVVYYHQGVGTGTDTMDRVLGGSTGFGISHNIRDAYNFLIMNYTPGDEIYLFGFSRGAYTARSLAGLVRNAGILRPERSHLIGKAYDLYRDRSDATKPGADVSLRFRDDNSHPETRIHFVGVWDTVGALGVPLGFARYALKIWGALGGSEFRYEFHDVTLSSRVDHAYHAVSRHERREPFRPTLWMLPERAGGQTFAQKWFDGVHCDVGGGYVPAGLSDASLVWMAQQAKAVGLDLDLSVIDPCVKPNGEQKAQDSQTMVYRVLAVLKKLNAYTLGIGFSKEEIEDLKGNVDWSGNYVRAGRDESVGEMIRAQGPRSAA